MTPEQGLEMFKDRLKLEPTLPVITRLNVLRRLNKLKYHIAIRRGKSIDMNTGG